MGLFDKKFCDICGERIRFLGNRKLEDGNLCKNCESKLSPWFSDRRRSTVEDIRNQLAYREENKQKVADFKTSRTLGENTLLLIDDEKEQFLFRRPGESLSDNPDVLSLADVTGCEVETEHSKTEQKTKDAEGKFISYDPPRHTHSYRFYLNVRVNHPWFDDMRVRVNRSNVEIETGLPRQDLGAAAFQAVGALAGLNLNAPVSLEPDTEHDEAYQKYAEMAESMRRALLRLPEEDEPAPEAPAAPAPAQKIQCPCCAAVAVPDADGRCPYCGEKMA